MPRAARPLPALPSMVVLFLFFPSWNVLLFCLCNSFMLPFHLNADSPNEAQQLSPHRSDDFLLLLASCA